MMRRDAGFSMLELTVALLLLSVAILGMASVLGSSAKRQALTASRMEMTALAESQMEALRGYASMRTADTLKLGVGGSLTASVAYHADTVQSPRGRWFLRRWLVANGAAGARDVTLRIEPRDEARYDLSRLDFSTLILIQ